MMREEIYDAKQHIDMERIKAILEKNKGKAVICFGGGTAADILMENLLYQYDVKCFLDNDKQKQGTIFHGKEICTPEILQNMEKGSYIVLILSKHVNAICKQLQELGVSQTDYYDIYNEFIAYFRIKKYEKNAYDFLDFIERIPEGTFDGIPVKTGQKIGIVCLGEMIKNLTWYSMAQSILLRYKGYRSTLIIDTLRSFDSYIYFDGMEAVAKVYIDYVVKVLQRKCKGIDVVYIDEQQSAELDESDLAMSRKYAPLVVKWFDSRRDEVFLPKEARRIQIAEELLNKTMSHIKLFLDDHPFDTINVYTGIHRHRCVYTYLGEKMGIRVSTYDGDDNQTVLYETDGISGHSYDITKLVKGNMFSEQEKEHIIELAKAHFQQRRHSTSAEKETNYQTVKAEETIVPYDIIIPLNILWDSAALGRNDIFTDEIEWLKATLDFLIKHTDATVMVREHPAQNKMQEFLFRDCEKELPIIDQYPDRIFYARAAAPINTYQYIDACKLVLPYTSTVGLESAMMGKNVILHTKIYYDDIGIAYKAHDKQDYFNAIQQGLKEEAPDFCQNRNNAYLAYYFQMKHPTPTVFGECFTDWMKLTIEEVSRMDGVDKIVGVIAENEPAIYRNVKESF